MLRPIGPREGQLVPIVKIVCTEHEEEHSADGDRSSLQTAPIADSDNDFAFRQKMDAAHDRWLLYLD